MEKRIVSCQDIREMVDGYGDFYKKGSRVSIIMAVIMMAISLPFLKTPMVMLFLCSFIFFGIGIVCFFKSKSVSRKKELFYIKEDACYSYSEEKDDSDFVCSYYISFNKHGNHKLTGIMQSAEEMYNNVFMGDRFYLVFTNNEKAPLFVIPQKEFEIDKTQFKEENDRYIPLE